ncbi:MAG TPA: NTP transferase domain-containing protein [Jiangellaceae bacterium]|nr:NTP transferase domain-containing protein [Jiangellaceae bacterium]
MPPILPHSGGGLWTTLVPMSRWDAVVLAGGRGRRLGGVDKPSLVVAGRTLLDTALDACAEARATVVVGPRRPTKRPVDWTREEPPGGGPLAALAAGVRALPPDAPLVVVVAADLPAVSAGAVRGLVEVVDRDGAVAVDTAGRIQPLLAAYRTDALRQALAAVGDPHGRPMHDLVETLSLTRVPTPDATDDIDTPGDLARWQEGRP